MTSATSSLLYNTALAMPLFPLEDVFMTGMVMHRSGVTPHNIPDFLTDQYERMGTEGAKQWVALHSVNTSTMYRLWNKYMY